MRVTEKSRYWTKLTTALVLFNADLLSTRLVDGIDHPLCFYIGGTLLLGRDDGGDILMGDQSPDGTST